MSQVHRLIKSTKAGLDAAYASLRFSLTVALPARSDTKFESRATQHSCCIDFCTLKAIIRVIRSEMAHLRRRISTSYSVLGAPRGFQEIRSQ
jgi:hypothetical protein